MVFNKEKEIPRKAAGLEKGAVQQSIKTYCDAVRGETSHLSCHGNIHASLSTNSQLLSVCGRVCLCRHYSVLLCHLNHWCVVIYDAVAHYHIIDLVIK